ncbi:MAG: DNA pilot protein [Microviridae sp.]|nr:MAG: DNA pilot protein [Microviridae sp.]
MLDGGITAALGAGGAILGYMGQKDTNDTNMQLGQAQMAFQERMSSSAYQRAVVDMQSAGLNPMLAYSQGGASSPVGSMPQVNNAVAAGASTAMQSIGLLQGMAQVERIKAETEKIKGDTLVPGMGQELARVRASLDGQRQLTEVGRRPLLDSQTAINRLVEALKELQFDRENMTFSADVARRKAESRLKELDIPRMEAEAGFYKSGTGEVNPQIRQILEILKGFTSAFGAGGRR